MRRLFAFGDSFTCYAWPMWPNILCQSYFDLTYNYGHAGSGNFSIFLKLVHCLSEKNISSDDVVVIEWTAPTRFDTLINGHWATNGDSSAEVFRNEKLEVYNSDVLCVLKQLSYMVSAARMLEQTGCKWYYAFLTKFSMVHLPTHGEEFNIRWDPQEYITPRYQLLIDTLQRYKNNFLEESMSDYVLRRFGNNSWKYTHSSVEDGILIEYRDTHPSPLQSYSWLENCLLTKMPELNLNLSQLFSYSRDAEELLDSLCDSEYKFNLRTLSDHFSLGQFETAAGYKKIHYV